MAFQDGRWIPVNDPMWDQADESCYLGYTVDQRLAVIGVTYHPSTDAITGSHVIEVAPADQQYTERLRRWQYRRDQNRGAETYRRLLDDEQARRIAIIRYKLGTATPDERWAVEELLDPTPF